MRHRILIISEHDYSGSGYKLAEALRLQGVDCRVVVDERKGKYPVDYCLQTTSAAFAQELVDAADIIHYKGDDVPLGVWHGLDFRNKRTLVTVAGSGFRRHGENITSQTFADISDYKTMIKTAFTPDLIYNNEWIFTPQTIGGNEYLYNYKGRHLIQHSPSSRAKKGTDTYILPAIELLKQKYDFDFELLEEMSNVECMERKRNGTIFIDQVCTTGWYGIAALESMRYGIPVVAHLSEAAVMNSGIKNSPIVNVGCSIDSVYKEVEKLLKIDCKQLSKDTYKYFENVHGNESVSKRFINIYNELMEKEIKIQPPVIKRTYDLPDMNTLVIVKWTKDIGGSYPMKMKGVTELQPLSTANGLVKNEMVEILKLNDMVQCEVIKPILIDGENKQPGDVVEVSYVKAERLSNQGDLKIIEFEKEVVNVEPKLPEQDAADGDVEQAAPETEEKPKRKRNPRKKTK